jgi:hypothetical protein
MYAPPIKAQARSGPSWIHATRVSGKSSYGGTTCRFVFAIESTKTEPFSGIPHPA